MSPVCRFTGRSGALSRYDKIMLSFLGSIPDWGPNQDKPGFWRELDRLEMNLLMAIYRGEKPAAVEAALRRIRDHVCVNR